MPRALIAEVGGKLGHAITAADVAAVCARWEGLKAGTRLGYHCTLRRCLEILGAPLQAACGIPSLMTPAPRDAALRSGTLTQLCPAMVDGDKLRVPTKPRGHVIVPMSPRLAARVAIATQHCETPQTPFVTALGMPPMAFRSSALTRRLHKAQERAGCARRWTWHDLRRTAARQLYARTGDLHQVQALLGHKSLTATLWYLQSSRRTLTTAEVAVAASGETP